MVEPNPHSVNDLSPKQKLYCYVDETGQDASSERFTVVAVVSVGEQHGLSEMLREIERKAKTGHRKWHKTRPTPRQAYLNLVLERQERPESVYFGSFPKPIPFFFPMIEVVSQPKRSYSNLIHGITSMMVRIST